MNGGALRTIFALFGDRARPEHVREDPFRVLIGCILSQRTKDEVTDRAYARLFSRYSSVEDLARADPADIEALIYPVGFYRTKARTIVRASAYILEHFGGRVPDTLDELIRIPGIGRKCANIVLAYGFGIPAIPVDTHVRRVSKRLGLVDEKASDEEVEEALKALVPRKEWINVNHALVRFGQQVCRPVSPLCANCPVQRQCPSAHISGRRTRGARTPRS